LAGLDNIEKEKERRLSDLMATTINRIEQKIEELRAETLKDYIAQLSKLIHKKEEPQKCCMCQDDIPEPERVGLPCAHVFCRIDLTRWIEEGILTHGRKGWKKLDNLFIRCPLCNHQHPFSELKSFYTTNATLPAPFDKE